VPVSLLGVTELSGMDGAAVHIGGLRRRAVLAALALEANRAVGVERLLDIVWDERPPLQARAALQGHIAVLRRRLPAGMSLETHGHGYRLCGDPDAVDSLRFAKLVTLAEKTTDDGAAVGLLESALGLWRGEPLADLEPLAHFRAASDTLSGARCAAVEAWAWRELRLGTGVRVVPALQAQLRGDAVRESLISVLMLCLDQGGRQAEALEVFQRARMRLHDELGVRPGPQLQDALERVLRTTAAPGSRSPQGLQAGPAWMYESSSMDRAAGAVAITAARGPVPRLLPRPCFGFVGRDADLGRFDALSESGGERLAIVSGAAGVGKSALIAHWAHRAAEHFPDGQLYADLRGNAPDGPADPGHVLAGFLRAMGLDEARLPPDAGSAAALLREVTRDRRILIVLDDARDADQVRPLLPDGPGAAAVVASRFILADLAVDRAAALHLLPPLAEHEAVGLLELIVDARRLHADKGATARLVELCDRLPLALRLAASVLALRPAWSVGDLVGQADAEHGFLEVLDRGGLGFSAALDQTRRRLSPTAARLLPLLGAYPGAEIDAYEAAVLLETEVQTASQALMNLAAWNVVLDGRPGRYAWSGLVGMYARGLMADEIGPRRARAAHARLAAYLANAAAGAADAIRTGNVAASADPMAALFASLPPGSVRRSGSYDGPLPRWQTADTAVDWLRSHEEVLRRVGSVRV
jgi:DNA-binding SARP family transcriptional activator